MVDIGEAQASKVMEIATEMDARRVKQIQNQRDSIDRLLNGDHNATVEITRLNLELAREQRKFDLLCEILRRESGENMNLTRGEIEGIIAQAERESAVELPASQD